MNGFRITVLVLLALALGLMFYVVTVFLPAERAGYAEYQEAMLDADYQKKVQEHRARMEKIRPETESSDVDRERQELARKAEERAQELKEREEARILEEGKRAEEARKQREAQASAKTEQSVAESPVALVTAYDHANNILMLKPVTEDGMLAVGQVLAIRRNGGILCEIVTESRDEESGQYSAYVKNEGAGAATLGDEFHPRSGDEVIVSSLPQLSDLPSLKNSVQPSSAVNNSQEDDISVALPNVPNTNKENAEEIEVELLPVQP